RQLAIVRWGLWFAVALLFASAAIAGRARGLSLYAAVALVPVFAYVQHIARRASRLVARRAYARLRTLVGEGEFSAAHDLVQELRSLYAGSASALELMRVYEATVLALEQRHREAVTLLESVDRRRLNATHSSWLLNNLAWSLAQVGDGARAVST